MIERDDLGSWINGAPSNQKYPGEIMGRPETGPGAIARPMRRLLGFIIDWYLCLGLAFLLVGGQKRTNTWSNDTRNFSAVPDRARGIYGAHSGAFSGWSPGANSRWQARWLEASPYPSCADHAGVAHRNFGCEFTRSSRSRGRNYTCAHPLDANCIAGELILFSGY